MVLVDTSVLIDYIKGQDNAKTRLFAEILARDIPFGISPYTYQEVLQGARDDREYGILKDYLSVQTIYALPSGLISFEQAARIYFDLRRRGLTLRSTIDVHIALTSIHHNLSLLHNDRDFDAMAGYLEGLHIWSGLGQGTN